MYKRQRKECVIVPLSSSKEIAKKISNETKYRLVNVTTTKFSDGEIMVSLNESVRQKKVYIIQSTNDPVNDNLMELLITIDAVKRSDPEEIVAIIPYFGYARQDRRAKAREPITAKLVADLLKASGVNKVISVQMHTGQIVGFFDCYCENLTCIEILANSAKKKKYKNVVVVSPDHGGANRARNFAEILNSEMAIVDKRRVGINKVKTYNIIGDVRGKTAIIVDDMIDTAGTITEATKTLIEHGAKEIYVYCVHGVFSGPASERLNNSLIKKIYCTDTIKQDQKIERLEIISIAKFLSEVLINIDNGNSVAKIIEKYKKYE